MDEYIEREAVYRAFSTDEALSGYEKAYCKEIIKKIPSADVATVRHGRWTWNEEGEIDWEQFYRCANCGDKEYWESNFCPNCVAKMDGGEDDGTST